MTRMPTRAFALPLIAIGLYLPCLAARAETPPAIPAYLQLARDFAANTRQENNAYSNRWVYTRLPGEQASPGYVVFADCSSFVEDMLRRTASGVLAQIHTQPHKTRRRVLDFYHSIVSETAFIRIRKVSDIQPGDVAAWRYRNRAAHQQTGHILFVDSSPVRITPRPPVRPGLAQYEFALIDTSQEAKSRDDTRYVSDAALRDENEARGVEGGTQASPNYKGVGRGHMRFYADSAGLIQGVAFSFPQARYHADGEDWDIVIGRPRLAVVP